MSAPKSFGFKPSQRGATLIELVVTLAVASIIMSAIAFTTQNFFRFYQHQLDKATALQEGRVAIDMIRYFVRRTGWGFQANIESSGNVFVGKCTDDGVPGAATNSCNNLLLDGRSDRFRIAYGLEPGFQAGVPELALPAGVPAVIEEEDVPDPLAAGLLDQLLLISGNCGGGDINHNFVVGGADSGEVQGTQFTYLHNFAYNSFDQPLVATCGSGYRDYNFGRLEIADFKIDRQLEPGTPTLVVRLDPRVSWDVANDKVMVLARNIDDLQIQYGIDTDPPDKIDRIPDLWCNEPADLEDCDSGLASGADNLRRITALQIVLVVRSATYRARLDNTETSPELEVLDNLIEDTSDGYRRWIYRATIALRNNAI